MLSEYVLKIYADKNGEIYPDRMQALLADASQLGGDTAPLEYIEAPDEDPTKWGLQIRIEGDDR